MANAMVNAFFDPEMQTCVFGDASDEFWCLVITQCSPGDEQLAWDEQAGKHRLLIIVSGRFRHAQLRWHIVEKEGFLFGVVLVPYMQWVNGGVLPAAFFTDHKNLLVLFADHARPMSCTKPNRDRLTRWGLTLMGARYVIRHIDGEENRLADLGSRWGNPHSPTPAATGDATLRRLTGGPRPFLNRMVRRSAECGPAPGMKRVLRSPPPKVSDDVRFPDLDIAEFVIPAPTYMVRRDRVVASQEKYAADRPAGLVPSWDKPMLWENADGQVWIPRADRQMCKGLYAIAHQGMQGHRGHDVTLETLASRFFWKGMSADVTEFRRGCLHCLKLAEGDMVPRPLGSQLIPEYPGEVLMMDFIKIGMSRSGYMYVLMQADKLSRLVRFIATVSTVAVDAARETVRWSALMGLPEWLISDGGPHFANSLIEEMAEVLGIEHHITLPYCPWANGSVEVVGKDLLWTLRALLSELEASIDEWDLVLPLVEYAVNHRRRAILGGRSPVELVNGRQPRTAADLVLWSGVKMKDAVEHRLPADRADEFCAKLADSLDRMHEAARDKDEHNRRRQALHEAKKGPGMFFRAGDVVMVCAKDNQANRSRHSKPMVHWQGPYEVVGRVAGEPTKIEVRLVGEDDTSKVSWKRVRRIAGPNVAISQAVQNSALHDLQRFKVDAFDDWGFDDDGQVQVLVRWRGFDESERTWEPMGQLHEDVEVLLRNWVRDQDDDRLNNAYRSMLAAHSTT